MKMIIYLPLILLVFLAACSTSHVNPRRINKEAFPAAFNDTTTVLLIEKRTTGINSRGWNRFLKRAFRKRYTGKYELASIEEITNSPKYQDKKTYRYILTDAVKTTRRVDQVITNTQAGNVRSQETTMTYRLDYYLVDRLSDKSYSRVGVSSNVPAKSMKRISAVLNREYTQNYYTKSLYKKNKSKVVPNEDFEIQYMVEKTGASREEVRQARQKVGNDREKVEAYLKGR